MRAALALAAALAAGTALAQPQQDDAAAASSLEEVRTALAGEIARMKAEIAGIERLIRWQAALTRTAHADREEALRQRLPMSDCLESALAPLCDELTGLFRPEEGGEVPPAPPGNGERAP